jgi:integrase
MCLLASNELADQWEGTAMAGKQRIGLRRIRALEPGETTYDGSLPGHGARRQRSSAVSYFVAYRTKDGTQRWFTIGKHGAWTPDTARDEALRVLGEVAKGNDPAAAKQAGRKATNVSELSDRYMEDAEAGRLMTRRRTPKKASTLATDRVRVERHIKPLLGTRKVSAVTRTDVERFMHDVANGKTAGRGLTAKERRGRGLAHARGGQGTAGRTVALLGAIFTYAVRHRMRPDNPVHGVVRPADGRRDRRFSDAEYEVFGAALRAAETASIWPPAIAAARFLALTGWRSGEALTLRWDAVDLARRTATLSAATGTDTKTGRSVRPLSHAACDVLRNLPRTGALVFQATRGDGPMTGFRKLWDRIAKLGALPTDLTPHTLRHSLASLAGDLGYSDSTIGSLVGHQGRTITSRYIHTADAPLLAAADAVANRTAELMGEPRSTGVVVELRKASAP